MNTTLVCQLLIAMSFGYFAGRYLSLEELAGAEIESSTKEEKQ